jgi:hypothetical protein
MRHITGECDGDHTPGGAEGLVIKTLSGKDYGQFEELQIESLTLAHDVRQRCGHDFALDEAHKHAELLFC